MNKTQPTTILKIIIPSLILLPLTWFSNNKKLWINVTTYSFLINIIALTTLWHNNEVYTFHPYSSQTHFPLTALTIWFLPLILLGSQNHIEKGTDFNKKLYISMFVTLQILQFSASELITFCILFEATLIPTLITELGNQTD